MDKISPAHSLQSIVNISCIFEEGQGLTVLHDEFCGNSFCGIDDMLGLADPGDASATAQGLFGRRHRHSGALTIQLCVVSCHYNSKMLCLCVCVCMYVCLYMHACVLVCCHWLVSCSDERCCVSISFLPANWMSAMRFECCQV